MLRVSLLGGTYVVCGCSSCCPPLVADAQPGSNEMNIQFEERQISIAVICLSFALCGYVVLESCRRLWVVAIESVQYCVDVFGSIWRIVEW